MADIRFSCQTYAWSMGGDQYVGRIDQMGRTISDAGFPAIEPNDTQLGGYNDPVRLSDCLRQLGLELSSMCLSGEWLHPQEAEAERAHADRIIELTRHFPRALLLLVQTPGRDREGLRERQDALLRCIHGIARRATEKGITCSYHPNSPPGSIWRTREDYDRLLPRLDPALLKWTPDVGHLAKAQMDPLAMVREYWELVNHFHFKDMFATGEWALMGEGAVDFAAIIREVVSRDYRGWIVFEDECEEAVRDPDGVTRKDGEFIRATYHTEA
jgi:inosose dehydratase